MADNAEFDKALALSNPERLFTKPGDVNGCAELTRTDKIEVLNVWAFQVRQRLDAAAEGMLPDPPADNERRRDPTRADADLLRSIEINLESLVG